MEIRTRPGGRFFRNAFFTAGAFSLFFLLFLPSLSAKIQEWDFKKAEDYQFDSRKIKLEKGNQVIAMSVLKHSEADMLVREQYLKVTTKDLPTCKYYPKGPYCNVGHMGELF